MSEHCEGEPTINPWRESAHGTVYAVKVCACGEQFEYIEIERTNDGSTDKTK